MLADGGVRVCYRAQRHRAFLPQVECDDFPAMSLLSSHANYASLEARFQYFLPPPDAKSHAQVAIFVRLFVFYWDP